ncbi:MAG: hydrogenase expression/formation C-terminal domain-containing protein [Alphaproteobacteria bacterium]
MSGQGGIRTSGGTTFYFGGQPQKAKPDDSAKVGDFLSALAGRVDACLEGRAYEKLAVSDTGLSPETLEDVLGEGEIKLWIREPGYVTEAVESVMPGIWRLRRRTGTGEAVEDTVDVGPFPRLVEEVMDRDTASVLKAEAVPDGTMSAGPLLHEIGHYMAGDDPHTIVLTNLPMMPEDMEALNAVLGEGPVAGGSKGYSTTRVRSTRYRRVWRTNYLNSEGQVIYDAIEITRAPLSLAAPREDIEDGRRRLADLMKIYA